MYVRVGCEFRYEVTYPTPAVVQVQPRRDVDLRLAREEWVLDPQTPLHEYRDLYNNICQRLTLPLGPVTLRYDAVAEVTDEADAFAPEARQHPVEELPDEVLVYTLPSRYCLSDLLSDRAWELFGATEPGWGRVQAVCDWVYGNIRFRYGASTPLTTAADILAAGEGVCRDFAHLGVTFCRALNIPARYVFGYLPDIDVPPPDAPMDFCAWFEAYLGGRWWTFDPRNNARRRGRVLIGRGRDALDVAMVTTYGGPRLNDLVVWADAVDSPEVSTMATPGAGLGDAR